MFDRKKTEALYGRMRTPEAAEARWEGVKAAFLKRFGPGEVRGFSASGRAEICGNHTDHNHGKVLVAGISMDTLCAARPLKDEVIVCSEGYPEVRFSVEDLSLRVEEKGDSAALCKGILAILKQSGRKVGGFAAWTSSEVFRGAGVSSSAAFEVLVAHIQNCFYNDGALSGEELARVSQYAENVYFGKPSGLLDQMGVALGGLTYIDFADPQRPAVRSVSAAFPGYRLFLVNTGGDHANLTPAYAAVKEDMQSAAAFFGKSFLREVDEAEFYERMPELSRAVSGRAVLRAVHFFEENKRVERAAEAVRTGDMPAFLAAVNASGDSSWECLQNCWAEGDRAQRIPLGLTLCRRYARGGAVRVHGGGFAGTVLAFVPEGEASAFSERLSAVFGRENLFEIGIRNCGVTEL